MGDILIGKAFVFFITCFFMTWWTIINYHPHEIFKRCKDGFTFGRLVLVYIPLSLVGIWVVPKITREHKENFVSGIRYAIDYFSTLVAGGTPLSAEELGFENNIIAKTFPGLPAILGATLVIFVLAILAFLVFQIWRKLWQLCAKRVSN